MLIVSQCANKDIHALLMPISHNGTVASSGYIQNIKTYLWRGGITPILLAVRIRRHKSIDPVQKFTNTCVHSWKARSAVYPPRDDPGHRETATLLSYYQRSTRVELQDNTDNTTQIIGMKKQTKIVVTLGIKSAESKHSSDGGICSLFYLITIK